MYVFFNRKVRIEGTLTLLLHYTWYRKIILPDADCPIEMEVVDFLCNFVYLIEQSLVRMSSI